MLTRKILLKAMRVCYYDFYIYLPLVVNQFFSNRAMEEEDDDDDVRHGKAKKIEVTDEDLEMADQDDEEYNNKFY